MENSAQKMDDYQRLGMQVRIRTNSLEFEFAPNSHEFVDPSEFEFATSNSNSPLGRLNSPDAENPKHLQFTFTLLHMGMPVPTTIWHKTFQVQKLP